ncbi:protein containing cell adhesion domain [Desulfocucumis palustris]|uniref:Protein containing cell adhesion domain n=1 Tax=Desulfocucumis palustris TaxID=1898651 RepID=A0A2L2X8G4_9FIRM|nr:hypothetical protein [Desulfocucumis palustris]GBF32214.1 protein containing cell adhesion domain [Desulfocucumis palustris]
MATIGQQLTAPEAGWKRYDGAKAEFLYVGNWTHDSNTNYYNSTANYSSSVGSSVNFKFIGNKLRIISAINTARSSNVKITIDGAVNYINTYGNLIYNALVYEKVGLTSGEHTVIIELTEGKIFDLDAIDIDDAGKLIHPILTQKTVLSDMQIGDVIPCRYTALSGAVGTFSELGTCTADEIPVAGSATPDGLFYFIKVRKGLLIADRVVQHSISWDTLNAAKLIECKVPDIIKTSNVTASSYYSNYTPNKAFNGTTNDAFDCWTVRTANLPAILSFEIEQQWINKKYSITRRNDTTGDSPKSWKVEGSNDEIKWYLLHEVNNEQPFAQAEKRFYNADLNGYIKLKFTFLESHNVNYLSIGELSIISNTIIRSLSGGCAYADVNGNKVTIDQSYGGWPINNEWDTYIVKSDLDGKITADDNAVWHHKDNFTRVRDTSLIATYTNRSGVSQAATSSWRIVRGFDNRIGSAWIGLSLDTSNAVSSICGFRPVLEYKEDGSLFWS